MAAIGTRPGHNGPGRPLDRGWWGSSVGLDTAPGWSQGCPGRRPRHPCAGAGVGPPGGRSGRGGVPKTGGQQRTEGVLRLALSIGRLQGPCHGPRLECPKASVAQPHLALVLVLVLVLALALAGLWEVGRLV